MVHALHFEDGQAQSYSNHWIRCDRFIEEKEHGSNLYMRVCLPLHQAHALLLHNCTAMKPNAFPCQCLGHAHNTCHMQSHNAHL